MAEPRETSLRRGVAILQALGGDGSLRSGGLRVTDLVAVVGREKSQVSRTLKTLAELGLVERDAGALRYRLGWRLYALAARAGDQRLLDEAAPRLHRLVAEVGERAHLSVLKGDEVLTLLSESSPHSVQAAGWTGRTVPCWCTSSGRALLLDHDLDALRVLLAGARLGGRGPDAPSTVDALFERIRMARERGVAVVVDEYEEGLVGVAAPVRDFRGRLVAALNVSGPKFRLGPNVHAAAGVVRGAAADLSASLGGTRGTSSGDGERCGCAPAAAPLPG